MNKRLFLNVMIVAMLTFYLIFNIVYQRLVNRHDSESEQQIPTTQLIWEQPVLVPEQWQLIRLELSDFNIQIDTIGNWSTDNQQLNSLQVAAITHAWQTLQPISIISYQQLPRTGKTILAFVAEDSQPLVYRVVEQGDELQIFRMIDKKQFNYPIASKSKFLAD